MVSKETFFETNAKKLRIELDIGLDKKARKSIVDGFSLILADTYLLMLKTHCYHWNIKGQLFSDIYDITSKELNDLYTAVNTLAKRIRALGFDAPGSFVEFSEMSVIGEAEKEYADKEILADLTKSNELLARNIRSILKITEKNHDHASTELLIKRLQKHEQNAWQLRSILEK